MAHTAASRADWFARLAIVAVFTGLAIYTWAHWGDVDVDSGREMYVPAALARGKVLYRDLWYAYGPVAPYLLAGLFRFFGASLYTLYSFGLATALGFALVLFQVSRRFLAAAPAFLVSFCALLQSFQADIFNYILPYSYAATVGSLIALACLYFVLRSIFTGSRFSMFAAGCCAGLALLSKGEFGFACYATVGFAVIASRPRLRNALACAPGCAAGLITYLWMGLRYSAPILLLERFFHSQTQYLMQAYGARWIAEHGLRFRPAEILEGLALLAASLLIWYVVARLPRWGFWCFAAVILPVARYGYRHATEFVVFPSGMFWLSLAVFVYALFIILRRDSSRDRQAAVLPLAILSVYAMTAGIRVMSKVVPRDYAIFYNSALFLVFVIALAYIAKHAATSFSVRFVVLHAAWLGLLIAPYPKALPSKLVTPRGVIYTRPAEAALFPRIISFIEEKKAQGQAVLVLPEANSLYFFTGTDAPARWYQFIPGVLAPDEEDELIAQLERQHVEFILLSNRYTGEYGVDYFGLDYNQRVYRWILDHYELQGQFGDFARGPGRPFAMQIYRRR
jgi:hypothetical protein